MGHSRVKSNVDLLRTRFLLKGRARESTLIPYSRGHIVFEVLNILNRRLQDASSLPPSTESLNRLNRFTGSKHCLRSLATRFSGRKPVDKNIRFVHHKRSPWSYLRTTDRQIAAKTDRFTSQVRIMITAVWVTPSPAAKPKVGRREDGNGHPSLILPFAHSIEFVFGLHRINLSFLDLRFE
jgi:hypothetical protein